MTRKSKIARLPRPVRDELNQRLDNGEPAIRLVEWLNNLPEVQQILAREFQGRPITPQNVSEWKRGGYHDWLAHQEQQATLRDFLADAKELGEAASPEKLTEAMFTFVTVHYAAAMYECTYRPENRDKLNLWSPILNDVIRLRNSDLAQQRFELDTQRLELQTEVARHRLELDRARLDAARQQVELDRQRLELARQETRPAVNLEEVPTLSPGLRRDAGRYPGNPSPEIVPNPERVASRMAQNLNAGATPPSALSQNTEHATRNTAPPLASPGPIQTCETSKHPLIIKHLQPNQTILFLFFCLL